MTEPNSRLKCKPYPTKMDALQSIYAKTTPFGVAHTYTPHIREYTPPPPVKSQTFS